MNEWVRGVNNAFVTTRRIVYNISLRCVDRIVFVRTYTFYNNNITISTRIHTKRIEIGIGAFFGRVRLCGDRWHVASSKRETKVRAAHMGIELNDQFAPASDNQ